MLGSAFFSLGLPNETIRWNYPKRMLESFSVLAWKGKGRVDAAILVRIRGIGTRNRRCSCCVAEVVRDGGSSGWRGKARAGQNRSGQHGTGETERRQGAASGDVSSPFWGLVLVVSVENVLYSCWWESGWSRNVDCAAKKTLVPWDNLDHLLVSPSHSQLQLLHCATIWRLARSKPKPLESY